MNKEIRILSFFLIFYFLSNFTIILQTLGECWKKIGRRKNMENILFFCNTRLIFYKHHLYKHREPQICPNIKHHLSTSLSLTSLQHTIFVIQIPSIFQILVCSQIQIFINEMYCELCIELLFISKFQLSAFESYHRLTQCLSKVGMP